MLATFFLSFYCSVLVLFSFVSHPLLYCLLLVLGSLCLSFSTILFFGFSWYIAVFVIVYVGGVYVLFLFVSVHNPNSWLGAGDFVFLLAVFFCSIFFLLFFVSDFFCFVGDESYFVCGSMEGFSYLVLCLSLLVGFCGISVVSSQKDSFFR